jgi:hypothetical protein
MDTARNLAAALSDGECPECGGRWDAFLWIDRTKEPTEYRPHKPCETCWKLRATEPDDGGIDIVEIVPTPTREEVEARGRLPDLYEVRTIAYPEQVEEPGPEE